FDGRLQRVFDAYLAREVPLDNGALATFVDGTPYRAAATAAGARQLVKLLAPIGSATEPRTGELSTPSGEADYVAIPVAGHGGQRGALVAASLLGGQRQQVEDAVR